VSSRNITDDRLAWSINDFARALGVSGGLIRLEIARGRLKAAHVGRRVVISRAEGDRYLKVSESDDARNGR
jgi:excisionase family DNA binding protein